MILPAVASLASLVVAFQAKPDPFDYHCADVFILQAKAVQAEIKLTEAQRKKMNSAAEQHRKTLQSLEKKYGNTQPSPETLKKVNPQIQKSMDDLKKNVVAALSAAQLKRVREINLQRMDVAALADDKVGQKIGMTSAQVKKIRDLITAEGQKVSKLQQDAANPILTKYQSKQPKNEAEAKKLQAEFNKEMEAAGKKVAPKVLAAQKSTRDKVLGMLTSAQKAAFTALKGKPFKA